MIEEEKRRISPRVKCNWPVKCVTEDKKTFNTRAVNISQGGVQLLSPVSFKKGDRLYMEIAGYTNGIFNEVKVVGLIVYVSVSSEQGIQLGLEFVSPLTLADSKYIQQFIKQMLGG